MRRNQKTKEVQELAAGDGLLTERDVARMTGMSVATVQHWRYAGTGPKYLKIGKSVRYHLADVRKFIASLPTGGGKPLNA